MPAKKHADKNAQKKTGASSKRGVAKRREQSTVPIWAVVLAGGQGSRFWPISRQRRPKQFLSISSSGESLLQATVKRVRPLTGGRDNSGGLLIVTNCMHEKLVRQHVPAARIVSEPSAKNTAASIGLAAVYLEVQAPKSVMLVLPADHAVSNAEKLRETLMKAARLAQQRDLLVTIGVAPLAPVTAYGYIKRGNQLASGVYQVGRFFEKPNQERARQYCDSGDFFWNSGMFAWRPAVILAALREFMPALHDGLMRIKSAIGGSDERKVIAREFAAFDAVSIDFGVLEFARNCAVVVGEPFGWNDVGSWDAWADHFAKTPEGNLLHGDAIVLDGKNCIVHSEHQLTVLIGAEDLVVINAQDAVLVCPRDKVQDVRKVVEYLKKKNRNDLV